MTLRDYLELLNEFVEENPESLDYQVVYGSDEEGNSYHGVVYSPTLGNYNEEYDEFTSASTIEENIVDESYYFDEIPELNAVCIN